MFLTLPAILNEVKNLVFLYILELSIFSTGITEGEDSIIALHDSNITRQVWLGKAAILYSYQRKS